MALYFTVLFIMVSSYVSSIIQIPRAQLEKGLLAFFFRDKLQHHPRQETQASVSPIRSLLMKHTAVTTPIWYFKRLLKLRITLNVRLKNEGAAPVFHSECDVEFVNLLSGNRPFQLVHFVFPFQTTWCPHGNFPFVFSLVMRKFARA